MILPVIRIGWPVRDCWPNQKACWQANKRARHAQREAAFFIAYAAGWSKPIVPAHDVHLTMTFCSPTRTSRFDPDGALSASKGLIDGLAACLDLDDSLFSYTLRRGSKSKVGGVIILGDLR